MCTSFNFKGLMLRLLCRLMLRPEVRNIFQTGRPKNLKLDTQTEHEDPYRRQAPWPLRSKVKVAMSPGTSDRYSPISRGGKIPEIPKLVRRLPTPCAIMCTNFKVKGHGQSRRKINALVADATWLTRNRLTDVTAVGDIPCPRHSFYRASAYCCWRAILI